MARSDRCCDEHGCTRKQPLLLLPGGMVPGAWYVVTRYTVRDGQPARVEAQQKHRLDAKTCADLTRWRDAAERRHTGEEIALAWHDATCPESQDCPDRRTHSRRQVMVHSGVVHRFLERLGVATEEAGW